MKLKHAVCASVIWTIIVIGCAVAIVTHIATHRVPGMSADERAARAGAGTGIVASIGYGLIWIPYAAIVGRRRRQDRRQAPRR